MMKKTKLIIVLLVLFVGIFSLQAYAQSQDTVEFFNIESSKYRISQLENDIHELIEELNRLDNIEISENNNMSDRYTEVRSEIVKVIQDINFTTSYISQSLKKINIYKLQITNLNNELKSTRGNINETKGYIQDFATFLYKMENEISNRQGDIDIVKLVTKYDNMASTMVNKDMLETMMIEINNVLKELEVDEQKYIELIKKLSGLKQNSLKEIQGYNTMLEKLHQKKNYLAEFISLYKVDALRQEKFQTVFDSKKDLYFAITDMVNNISLKRHEVDFDFEAKIKELDTLTTYEKEKKFIGRPMYPITDIQTYFKDADFEKDYGVPHIGIQIPATQGTPIYASKEGVVYYVHTNEVFGVNRLLMVHNNNYITAYVYMNEVLVNPGDIIRKGQIVGYSGGEPGTTGAGFISQSPNLTFMLFRNGISVDPIPLLDLSILSNKNDIPKDYKIKYLNDKYSREIDVSNVRFIDGEDLDQRAKSFLNKYAVGNYRTLSFRNQATEGSKIDRDVLICIGFAESTLGQYLSTNNNIGNVGNDDSGNRIDFDNPVIGARAIANTLNNRHLGDYHTILQLSRYGNNEGMIYASSPINWQTNMIKCLSMIKGYYVPEDYPFRTGPNPNKLP